MFKINIYNFKRILYYFKNDMNMYHYDSYLYQKIVEFVRKLIVLSFRTDSIDIFTKFLEEEKSIKLIKSSKENNVFIRKYSIVSNILVLETMMGHYSKVTMIRLTFCDNLGTYKTKIYK